MPKEQQQIAESPARTDQPKKAIKKRSAKDKDDVKFSVYIAKANKNLHGSERTVSSAALATFDAMTDHLIQAILANAKKTMRYAKTNTFNRAAATGAASLTLTGVLQKSALGAGVAAAETFAASEAAKPPKAKKVVESA